MKNKIIIDKEKKEGMSSQSITIVNEINKKLKPKFNLFKFKKTILAILSLGYIISFFMISYIFKKSWIFQLSMLIYVVGMGYIILAKGDMMRKKKERKKKENKEVIQDEPPIPKSVESDKKDNEVYPIDDNSKFEIYHDDPKKDGRMVYSEVRDLDSKPKREVKDILKELEETKEKLAKLKTELFEAI
jgi:hypothetical protein